MIVVRVQVSPARGRSAVVGRHGDAVKLRVGGAARGGPGQRGGHRPAGHHARRAKDAVELASGANEPHQALPGRPDVDVAEAAGLLSEAVSAGTAGNAGGRSRRSLIHD